MYRNLKSWQLFLLLFSLVLVDGVIPFTRYDLTHLLLRFSFIIVYFHWIYLTSKQLTNKASSIIKISWRFFMINYVYNLIYIIFIFILYESKINIPDTVVYLLTPLHLYDSFCIIYFFWFMSKNLTSLEANQETTNKVIINTIFLFWFLPIGIWWLQPRIREMLAK